jgi:hypothetical protein
MKEVAGRERQAEPVEFFFGRELELRRETTRKRL